MNYKCNSCHHEFSYEGHPKLCPNCDSINLSFDIDYYDRDPSDKALRYNDGKPEWTLVDFDSLESMVRVLEFGAKKYARENWKKPMDKKKILDSLMRHLVRLMADEELDSESKLPHIGHILANCMMYSYHSRRNSWQT